MAGGKETPRQKMINLMYLVLIAMLALQVSSTVILKFEQLNNNLESNNQNFKQKNNSKFQFINAEVNKRSDPSKMKVHLNQANAIKTKTAEISAFMESLKKELVTKTGGYDENGNLKGAKEETKVEVVMLGSSKNGQAYELKKKLDEHIKWVNQQDLGTYKMLALNGKEHPFFKAKTEQKNKDFAELNFANSPLVASLATISELENNILAMERVLLGKIADKMSLQEPKVDRLIPVVKTNSNYVVAGKKYEAELFLSAKLATEAPTMQMNTSSIDVNEDGVGTVSFTAAGGNFGNSGTVNKSWTGKITMKLPDGTDTTYTVTQEYTVAKPTLQFQSAAVQSLYLNCGNNMNVSVPELGAEFNPKYQITGGKVTTGSTRGSMTIVPKAASVSVKVSSDGTYLGTQKFKVRRIPLPTIEAHKSTGLINAREGIKLKDLNKVKLKVNPDKSFKEFLPNDARYRVTKWKAILARGRSARAQCEGTGNNIRLTSDFPINARDGDRIIIEVVQLKRLNYKNKTEVVTLPPNQ